MVTRFLIKCNILALFCVKIRKGIFNKSKPYRIPRQSSNLSKQGSNDNLYEKSNIFTSYYKFNIPNLKLLSNLSNLLNTYDIFQRFSARRIHYLILLFVNIPNNQRVSKFVLPTRLAILKSTSNKRSVGFPSALQRPLTIRSVHLSHKHPPSHLRRIINHSPTILQFRLFPIYLAKFIFHMIARNQDNYYIST